MTDEELRDFKETLDLVYSRFRNRNTSVITKEEFEVLVDSFMYLRAYKRNEDKE